MDVFTQFLERWTDYQRMKTIVDSESEYVSFPSEQRQQMWDVRRELKAAFKDAVRDVLLS